MTNDILVLGVYLTDKENYAPEYPGGVAKEP